MLQQQKNEKLKMPEPLTILIADDHPIFRSGVNQVLAEDPLITVVAEEDNGDNAFRKISDLQPDIAILDINMPKMTGLDIARRVSAMNLETKIILLTMLDDKKIFLEAMDAGVMGYILKDSAVSEILRAVHAVTNDRHYLSPTLSEVLLQKRSALSNQPSVTFKELTPTEIRIMRAIAELQSNQEIADELFISKRTVENHRTNIAKKLSLKDSNAVLKFALQHKSELE
jgi:two-component system, NarL family, response regulator DegU